MSMFDMMLNEAEKKKMVEALDAVLTAAFSKGFKTNINEVENAVERVLIKHGIITPKCNCGADTPARQVAEKHALTCPISKQFQ